MSEASTPSASQPPDRVHPILWIVSVLVLAYVAEMHLAATGHIIGNSVFSAWDYGSPAVYWRRTKVHKPFSVADVPPDLIERPFSSLALAVDLLIVLDCAFIIGVLIQMRRRFRLPKLFVLTLLIALLMAAYRWGAMLSLPPARW